VSQKKKKKVPYLAPCIPKKKSKKNVPGRIFEISFCSVKWAFGFNASSWLSLRSLVLRGREGNVNRRLIKSSLFTATMGGMRGERKARRKEKGEEGKGRRRKNEEGGGRVDGGREDREASN
jgi:hypothetical protein